MVYEDGDVERLKLNKERWELVQDTEVSFLFADFLLISIVCIGLILLCSSQDELGSPSTPASSEPGMYGSVTTYTFAF